jgi:hypothetical protein
MARAEARVGAGMGRRWGTVLLGFERAPRSLAGRCRFVQGAAVAMGDWNGAWSWLGDGKVAETIRRRWELEAGREPRIRVGKGIRAGRGSEQGVSRECATNVGRLSQPGGRALQCKCSLTALVTIHRLAHHRSRGDMARFHHRART